MGWCALRLKLPLHVHGFVDRHGKARHYLRKPGTKSLALPGLPYSPECMEAYQAGMAGAAVVRQVGAGRTVPGTVNAALVAYFNSETWAQLKPGTQRARRNILALFRHEHGDKRISKLSARPLLAILSKRKPFSARNWLKALRGLCQFAVSAGLLAEDATRDIKLKAPRSAGFHTWDEAQIENFEKRHAVGTKARLALGLLLYTAQRRGDVIRLGPQHVRAGALSVTQEKTGTEVAIPMHQELLALIEATPSGHLNFLVTDAGKPFTAAGFGNWFADRCNEAGLPKGCRAHGLRKAACRRLAEAGASAPEIAAISGHLSIKEVQRYIAAADRKAMAQSGMAKVERAFAASKTVNNRSQTRDEGLPNEGKKR